MEKRQRNRKVKSELREVTLVIFCSPMFFPISRKATELTKSDNISNL